MDQISITKSFKNYLKKINIKKDEISLRILPDLFLGYYHNVKFETIEPDNDADMMLFQYGIFNFGDGDYFQLDLTRQLIAEEGEGDDFVDIMYHLQVTFYYKPEAFESIPSFNKWSCDYSDLADFKQMIINSAGYRKALDEIPLKLEIHTDMI